jgi:hypothetical protein
MAKHVNDGGNLLVIYLVIVVSLEDEGIRHTFCVGNLCRGHFAFIYINQG